MRRMWLVVPVLAFGLTLAAPSPALALGDWIAVEGAEWRQGLEGNASINGDILGGTTFDFRKTLGMDDDDNTLNARVRFKFGKFRFVADAFDSTHKGSTTLTQNFTFNDQVYTAGQSLDSQMDFKLYQAIFLFNIADLKVVDFGVGLGLNEAKVNIDLDGSVSGQTTLDETIPYPTLAGYVTIKPFPAFHIRAEFTGARGNYSGTEVDLFDARAQIEFYIAHVLGFFAGYRQYQFDITDEGFGSVNTTFKGPFAGIGLKF